MNHKSRILSCGGQHCFDDFVVACAAAEVIGEFEADLFFGRVGMLFEQSFGSDDKAGRANAALQRGPFEEALLNRMELADVADAFDRRDLAPFGFDAEHEAAIHRPAVEQHRAAAAVAVAAAFFRAGEANNVAQNLEQALSRFAEKLRLLAVDCRRNVMFLGHNIVIRFRSRSSAASEGQG